MKKILVLISSLLLLFPFLVDAQKNDHLKFKNIPLDGSIDQFMNKMKNEGFSLIKTLETGAVMEGKFVNNDCKIYILATPKTKKVWKVVAQLPANNTWNAAKAEYKEFKSQYQTKYGIPTDVYEYFSKPYYEGDGYELQALKKSKCTFVSFWELKEGSIFVELKENGIRLGYEDKKNGVIKEKEDGDKIQSDI